MNRPIATHHTLESFFRELLEDGLAAERLTLDESTVAYLLRVVAEFGESSILHEGGRDERGTPALVWLYERAQQGDPGQRFEAFRHLGDVSLIVSGFFTPHIERERSLVGLDYYVQMGAAAYDSAAGLARHSVFAQLLGELAQHFKRLVEVLGYVAERTTLPVARDLGAVYERFMLNPGSHVASSRLLEQGCAPVFKKAVA
ncbi:MAG: hypothetical protein RIT81_19390 [Deltaproteobacteria bacterium]